MIEYAVVALLALTIDAARCEALSVKLRLVFAIPAALLWPITLPVFVCLVWWDKR